jgi:hypothetical protein
MPNSKFCDNLFTNLTNITGNLSINADKTIIEKNIFDIMPNTSKELLNLSGKFININNNTINIQELLHVKSQIKAIICLSSKTQNVHVSQNIVTGNNYNFSLLGCEEVHIIKADFNASDGNAALIYAKGKVFGPVSLHANNFKNSNFNGQWKGDPNRLENLSENYEFSQGDRIYYLFPVAGGKEGLTMTSSGVKEFGAITE